MARSTRLVILIKNIYTLWGRKRFIVPVTYFATNLVYPFTSRVAGINSSKTRNKNIRASRVWEYTLLLNDCYLAIAFLI